MERGKEITLKPNHYFGNGYWFNITSSVLDNEKTTLKH